MATVSERSKQTLDALRDVFKSPTVPINMTLEEAITYCDEKYAAIIEQALLAERRLAMEEAAKIASDVHDEEEILSNKLAHQNHLGKAREAWCWGQGAITVMQALRAAAEKEVSNG